MSSCGAADCSNDGVSLLQWWCAPNVNTCQLSDHLNHHATSLGFAYLKLCHIYELKEMWLIECEERLYMPCREVIKSKTTVMIMVKCSTA